MPFGKRSYVVAANERLLCSSIMEWWEGFDANNKKLLEDDLPTHFYASFKLISTNIFGGTCYLTIRIQDGPMDLRPRFTREIQMEVSTGEFMGESAKNVMDLCSDGIMSSIKMRGIVIRRRKKGFPASILEV